MEHESDCDTYFDLHAWYDQQTNVQGLEDLEIKGRLQTV